MAGPLKGVRIVEFAGLVAAPYCTMLLADNGAEIIRIDRKMPAAPSFADSAYDGPVNRGRRSIVLDLKKPSAIEAALRLIEKADIVIEGLRPGVMERLGLGPDICLKRNPRLVYGRITGWGQDGHYRDRAGHDVNYIAISGALSMVGRRGERPMPPLGALGDMAGATQLALGVLSAYIAASRTGIGQIVDAAMTDASVSLLSIILGQRAKNLWNDERGTNAADTGAHFYEVYETSDGKFMSVGAIEPQFYATLCKVAGLGPDFAEHQMDEAQWPALKERLAEVFRRRTRQEWTALFESLDACVMPVLSITEAAEHPQNVKRGTYFWRDGVLEPGPGQNFSRTPSDLTLPPPVAGAHSREVLSEIGYSGADIDALIKDGAVGLSA